MIKGNSNTKQFVQKYYSLKTERYIMVRKIFGLFSVILMLIPYADINAQSLTPSVLPSAGKYLNNDGYSLSGTLGEPLFTSFQNGNVLLTQGQQQPYISLRLLHIKAFLEGVYLGSGQMQPVLGNNYPLDFPSTACDSIQIELRSAVNPYLVVESATAILQTNGNAEIQIPATLLNAAYYIVLKHRNSIQTWSKIPVSISSADVWFDSTSP